MERVQKLIRKKIEKIDSRFSQLDVSDFQKNEASSLNSLEQATKFALLNSHLALCIELLDDLLANAESQSEESISTDSGASDNDICTIYLDDKKGKKITLNRQFSKKKSQNK